MHSHEGDEILFQMFQQLGLDLSKQREINFNFVFSTQDGLTRASGLLSKNKFETLEYEIPRPWWKLLFSKPEWGLTATRHLALDKRRILDLTTEFQKLARSNGGTYDGWEANVMGDNIDPERLQ